MKVMFYAAEITMSKSLLPNKCYGRLIKKENRRNLNDIVMKTRGKQHHEKLDR